jgi:hypothetical protein
MLYKELKNLKLDLNPSFVLPVLVSEQYKNSPYTKEEVLGKSSLIQLFNLGLLWHIRQIQIFTAVGNYEGGIHIDGTNPSTQEGAINWICNETPDSNWSTEWFKVKTDGNKVVTDQKQGPGSGILYKLENCEMIESWKGPCSIPTLLHVGVPHRIVNRSNTIRQCISIRFHIETQDFHKLNSLLD